MAVTLNFGWTIPTVGSDEGTWGNVLNTALSAIDAEVFLKANKAAPVFTGTMSFNAKVFTTGTATDIGYRGAPIDTVAVAYTFVAADAGRMKRHAEATARAWTIPTDATEPNLGVGDIIIIRNGPGAGVITLSAAAGATLNWAGSTSTTSRTLAAGAYASITKEAANTWLLTGAGIT